LSWFRIEGRMPNHRKVAPLSDAAFRLHVTAGCWSVEERTEGNVPRDVPGTLPAAPRGHRLTKAIEELTSRGLWEETEDGFRIHDFLRYNMSNDEAAAKAAAGSLGGKQSGKSRRRKKEADASPEPSKREAPASKVLKQTRSKLEAESESESESESEPPSVVEDPPDPPPRKPTNLQQALQVPLRDRAQLLLTDPYSAEWLQPQAWPEVLRVTRALNAQLGLGEPKLGRYQRDGAVRQAVELFAAGVTVDEILQAIPAITSSTWWHQARRDFGAITLTVLRRTQGPAPQVQPTEGEATEARRRSAEAVRKRAEAEERAQLEEANRKALEALGGQPASRAQVAGLLRGGFA
jgi:hypothetical protein